MDLAGGNLDNKQHVQTFAQHRVHGEKVHRQDAIGLGAKELSPGQGRPLGCRVGTGALQDGPDGAGPDPGAEPAQLTVDATVAPDRFSLASRSTSAWISGEVLGRPRRCG